VQRKKKGSAKRKNAAQKKQEGRLLPSAALKPA